MSQSFPMSAKEFETYVHQQIPITKEMGITVEQFDSSGVKVAAKLEPNLNHKSTAFGGSINSLLTICGWSFVFQHIKHIDPHAHIVIQKSTVHYLHPISTDFVAQAAPADLASMEKFSKMYQRYGRARIHIQTSIEEKGKQAATFEGQFVAFK